MPIKDPVERLAYAVKYRESRREEARERSRKWREQNPARLKKMLHDNYMRHREERKEQARQYRKEHTEEIALWRETNRDRLQERDRLYYESNREKRLEKDRRYRSTEHGKRVMVQQALRHQARNPVKWAARRLVRAMVQQGNLQKLPCAVCNTVEDVHAHHEDYTKPLDVVWLCRKHHQERHKSVASPDAIST